METVQDLLAGDVSAEVAIQEGGATQERNVLGYVGGPPWNKAFGLDFDNRNGGFRCQSEDIAVNLVINISISRYEDGLVPKLVDEL